MDVGVSHVPEGGGGADAGGDAVVDVVLVVAASLSSVRRSIIDVVTRSIPGRAPTTFGTGMFGLPTELIVRFFERPSWRMSSPQNVVKTVTS